MDEEIKQIRQQLNKALNRLLGKETMTKDEIRKKIEEAKAWISIMEESQATRKKYGQELATDFRFDLGNDAASARSAIDDLEKALYGGLIGALRKRVDNIERAFGEGTKQ